MPPLHSPGRRTRTPIFDGTGISDDGKGWLFRTIGRGTDKLTESPLPLCQCLCHGAQCVCFRLASPLKILATRGATATGITAYLKNGGTLEKGGRHSQPELDEDDTALRPPVG